MIPYGRQQVTDEDVKAVVAVLRSDFLTQGPIVPKFQAAVANISGAEYAVAANSATSALHIACLALDLGRNDELWTSPNTFVASANCGLYCGAKVDFVDIDPRTYNMSVDALEEKLIAADSAGRLPTVVVPVHFAGQSCDMAAIHALSQRYGFKIIEDASHAIGATYKDEPVGNCRYSDITVFSFHPVKIITSGEGGMALTNSADLAQRMAMFASHGVTRDRRHMIGEPDGDWSYQQIELGYNYRMTDLHAALGLSQIDRLVSYVNRRHEIAEHYNSELSHLPLERPHQSTDGRSALHLYPIWIDPTTFDRRAIFRSLRAEGIGVNVHYIPVHTQPQYKALGFSSGDFPAAEKYYAGALSIPIFPSMSEQQMDSVVFAITKALS